MATTNGDDVAAAAVVAAAAAAVLPVADDEAGGCVADAAINNCDKKACEFLTNILRHNTHIHTLKKIDRLLNQYMLYLK